MKQKTGPSMLVGATMLVSALVPNGAIGNETTRSFPKDEPICAEILSSEKALKKVMLTQKKLKRKAVTESTLEDRLEMAGFKMEMAHIDAKLFDFKIRLNNLLKENCPVELKKRSGNKS